MRNRLEQHATIVEKVKRIAAPLTLMAALGAVGYVSAIAEAAAFNAKRSSPSAEQAGFIKPVSLAFGCTGERYLIAGGGWPTYVRTEGKLKCRTGIQESITTEFQVKKPGQTKWRNLGNSNETIKEGYNYGPKWLETTQTVGIPTVELHQLHDEGDALRRMNEYTITDGSSVSSRTFTDPVTADEYSPSLQH